MNLIAFIGIFLFSRSLIQKRSIRAFIIMTNGFIYHGLTTIHNKKTPLITYLKYNDIITNILILIYSIYKTPHLSNYAIIGSVNFCVNHCIFEYLLKPNNFNSANNLNSANNVNYPIFYIDNMCHVILVHFPLAIGLEKILKIT